MPRLSAATSGRAKRILLDPAVELERADGCHDDRRLGLEPPEAALDVEELFRTEVGAEARLGEHDVAEGQTEPGGDEGVAAVGDVAEGAGVHERGPALEGLHQVRQDGVLEEQRHGAGGLELARGDGLPVPGEADDDPADARFEIGQVARERQDSHDLASRDDDEPVLAHRPGVDAAEADDDGTKRPVVHVHRARPRDSAGIEAECIALMQVIVEHCRQQIVRGRDGVKVPGEVEVDLVHGKHLRVAAARRSPFTPNTGPRLGSRMQTTTFLPSRRNAWLEPTVTVLFPSPAGVGLMPVTSTSRPVRPAGRRDLGADLGLVPTVRKDVVRTEPELGGDILNRAHLRGLRDRDV